MKHRRSEYDVSNKVNTTQPAAVEEQVRRIFLELYPDASFEATQRAFADTERLYCGRYPGYYGCDTWYHDLQHILDVTLAMARLTDGYERARNGHPGLGPELFSVGVITALFHDIGYLRRKTDKRHANGSEYTLHHVTRGAKFLRRYLPGIGMGSWAPVASRIIHFTGYEVPVSRIRLSEPKFRMLGNLLGSADIIAQMADRCYLEKCRDRLYPEFVLGGIARQRQPDGKEVVRFASPLDLVEKTPNFYQGAMRRLEEQLGGVYRYAELHFRGQNLYLEELQRTMDFARIVAAEGDLSLLKRNPPATVPNPVVLPEGS